MVISAPTTDPAEVPTTVSARVRSTPPSRSPLRIPISQAMPVTPPPPRTSPVRVPTSKSLPRGPGPDHRSPAADLTGVVPLAGQSERRGGLLAHLHLADLAGHRHRELVHDQDVSGDLVVGELAGGERPDGVRVERLGTRP